MKTGGSWPKPFEAATPERDRLAHELLNRWLQLDSCCEDAARPIPSPAAAGRPGQVSTGPGRSERRYVQRARPDRRSGIRDDATRGQ